MHSPDTKVWKSTDIVHFLQNISKIHQEETGFSHFLYRNTYLLTCSTFILLLSQNAGITVMVFQEVRFLLNFLGEGTSNTKSILTTVSTILRDSGLIG